MSSRTPENGGNRHAYRIASTPSRCHCRNRDHEPFLLRGGGRQPVGAVAACAGALCSGRRRRRIAHVIAFQLFEAFACAAAASCIFFAGERRAKARDVARSTSESQSPHSAARTASTPTSRNTSLNARMFALARNLLGQRSGATGRAQDLIGHDPVELGRRASDAGATCGSVSTIDCTSSCRMHLSRE